MTGNAVVLGVSMLVWVLLFVYLMRLDRRVKELEKR
ncbi:MAG: CcmD family protein [Candidatus Eisenbacteria bacterium]|uniref:CcmD family protein n=1 Tax=Eiseniibacteriota bacterium TaxID=2212470 RepID=A0A538UE28_UNCEI|nr:MAG: CcmD family protein [Candidatus Eisenbacteria bacterium]